MQSKLRNAVYRIYKKLCVFELTLNFQVLTYFGIKNFQFSIVCKLFY